MNDRPIRTSTQFLCRECLPACGGSLPHVVTAIDRYLNDYIPQRTFTSACERGAAVGTLEFLLAWTAPNWAEAVSAAARGGHLYVLRWMMQMRRDLRGPWKVDFSFALEEAATNNHTNIVKWLHNNGCCSAAALECALISAAENGNLKMLEWVLNRLSTPYFLPAQTMMHAALKGRFNIVRWLHTHFPEVSSSPLGMYGAAGDGHLELMKWLLLNGYTACNSQIMDSAASGGHFDIVKWLFDRGGTCSTAAPESAAEQGDLEMLRWFHEHFPDQFTQRVMDQAARHGHLDVVKWLHLNRREGCTRQAMYLAACNGFLSVVRWLHENRSEGYRSGAMNEASGNGHLEVVRYLHEQQLDRCSAYALHDAITNEHFDIVRYLYDANVATPYDTAIRKAVDQGYLEVLKVAIENNALEPYQRYRAVSRWSHQACKHLRKCGFDSRKILRETQAAVDWFADHGCARCILDIALREGCISLVQPFLERERYQKLGKWEVYGSKRVLRWFLENGLQLSVDELVEHIKHGYVEMMGWLPENDYVTVICDAFNAHGDHWESILEWASKSTRLLPECSHDVIYSTAQQAPLTVKMWLFTHSVDEVAGVEL